MMAEGAGKEWRSAAITLTVGGVERVWLKMTHIDGAMIPGSESTFVLRILKIRCQAFRISYNFYILFVGRWSSYSFPSCFGKNSPTDFDIA